MFRRPPRNRLAPQHPFFPCNYQAGQGCTEELLAPDQFLKLLHMGLAANHSREGLTAGLSEQDEVLCCICSCRRQSFLKLCLFSDPLRKGIHHIASFINAGNHLQPAVAQLSRVGIAWESLHRAPHLLGSKRDLRKSLGGYGSSLLSSVTGTGRGSGP